MSGQASLDAFIAGVEKLREANELVAKEAESDVAEVARANARKGISPTGEKWPDLADGGQALKGAAAAIESSTSGTRIVLKIGKPYVFHQHGVGGHSATKEAERHRKRAEARRASTGTKSKFHAPRRQILPDGGEPVPGDMKEAISKAAARVFGKATGG